MNKLQLPFSLAVAFLYAFVAGLWIFFSDRLLGVLFPLQHSDPVLQTYKGWLFVAVTALLLYVVLERRKALLERERSARTATERKWKSADEQYHRMIEKGGDAILLALPDGTILSANPAACRMFLRSEEDICALGRRGLVDMNDPRAAAALAQRERSGSFSGVLPMVRGNGETFPAQISSTLFTDGEGQQQAILIIRDVSEQQVSEAVLLEEMRKYQTLFECNPQPMWVYEISSLRFLAVNEAAVAQYGYSRDEFLRMTIREIRPAEELPRLMEAVSRLDGGYTASDHWLHRKKDGTIIEVEIRAHGLIYDGRTAELVVAADVTEQKRIVDQMEAMERYYRDIFNSTNEAIFIHEGATGAFIDVNDATVRLYGFSSKEEVLTQSIDSLSAGTPPYTGGDAAGHLEQAMQGGYHTFEWRARRKDGSTFWSEVSLRKTEINGRDRIIGVVRDVSDRKAAEQSLRKSEEFTRLVMDNLPVGIAVNSIDPSVDFSYMNENFARFYGTTREALREPDSFWTAVYEDPDERERIRSRVLADAATGDPERMHWDRVPIRRSGHTVRYVNARNTAIPDSALVISTVWDVTNETIAEQAKIESELRWKFALEGSGGGLWDWNMVTNEVYFSPQWKAMLGYEDREINNVLEEWEKRVEPQDLVRANAAIERHINGESDVYESECRMRCKDGTWKWIVDRGTIISRNSEGRPLRMIGFHTDVTERKRAEQEVAKSEERLRLALYAAQQGLYDLNVQTGEAIVSPEYATMLGYDPETFRETNAAWIERLHQEDREPTAEVFRMYIAGHLNEYRVEFRQRTRSGEWKWILSIGRVVEYLPDGRPLRMLGTHTDITERKRIEEQIRQSEEKYRNLIENSPDAIFINDDDTVTYANRACLAMFGAAEAHQLLGRHPIDLFHPDSQPVVAERIRRLLADQQPVPLIEERIIRLDGSTVTIETIAAPFRYGDRNMIHVIMRDISERKVQEGRILEQLHELQRWHEATLGREQRVLELKREVNTLLEEAGRPLRYLSATEPGGDV